MHLANLLSMWLVWTLMVSFEVAGGWGVPWAETGLIVGSTEQLLLYIKLNVLFTLN